MSYVFFNDSYPSKLRQVFRSFAQKLRTIRQSGIRQQLNGIRMQGLTATRLKRIQTSARGWWALSLCLVLASAVAGTPHLLRDINKLTVPQDTEGGGLGVLGHTFYFKALVNISPGRNGLYKSDGTSNGTMLVKSFAGQGPTSGFIVAGAKAYFAAEEDATGEEVWVTDGTPAGTHMVLDMNPGADGGVQLVGLYGSDLVFAAVQAGAGWQVFRTDGTANGTFPLTDFPPRSPGIITDQLITGDRIFMAISDGISSLHLNRVWVSDGALRGAMQINENPSAPEDLNARSMQQLGNSVLFVSSTPGHGTEIARIDVGTNALIFVEQNFDATSHVVEGTRIVVLNGIALYAGTDEDGGSELWQTDGTPANTRRVIDINPGGANGIVRPGMFTKVGNRLVFTATESTFGAQLWSSDGTAQGTERLTSYRDYVVTEGQIVGSRGYFLASEPREDGPCCWPPSAVLSTDGTSAGTRQIPGDVEGAFRAAGSNAVTYISERTYDPRDARGTWQLFRYEPQSNQMTLLKTQGPNSYTNWMLADGERALFSGMDFENNRALWISDGTVAGTRLLRNPPQEINTADSKPTWLTNLDGNLFFAANDGANGQELWKSDGTEAGTRLAFDVRADGASNPEQLFAWNGSLYFMATDDTGSRALMRTTGANGPLQKLATFLPHSFEIGEVPCPNPAPMEFNGRFYFAANDDSAGLELWSTDGTASGTARVTDLYPGPRSSSPCGLIVFMNRLYFSAEDGFGRHIFSTDGSLSGTLPLFAPPAWVGGNAATGAVFDDFLYFTAWNDSTQLVIWKSNGTEEGTHELVDGPLRPFFGSPVGTMRGKLVLTRPVSQHLELWVSDGTSSGTLQVPDVRLPPAGPVAVIADRVYFTNSNDSAGIEPWVSDGTRAGTMRLADLNPDGDSNPRWFVNFRGVAYLQATDPTRGSSIWRTNGTSPGTVYVGAATNTGMPHDGPVNSGQSLFFAGIDPVAGIELHVLHNEAPTAADDSASAFRGIAKVLNVLENDVDIDGALAPTSLQIVSAPGHGTVTVGTNGIMTYVADSTYVGKDSFTYRVLDDQENVSNTATVTLAVFRRSGGGSLHIADALLLAGLLALREYFARRRRWHSEFARCTASAARGCM